MEINSSMKNNYLKHYNIAKGIAVNKKRVLKHKTNKVPSYFISAIITIMLLTIFYIVFLIVDESNIVSTIFLVFICIYIIYTITRTIWSYNFKKKKDFINKIILDENGLTDHSFHNIKINLSWDRLKAIVIKKETITIITDTYLYFFFDKSTEKEILKAVNNYQEDMLIIR